MSKRTLLRIALVLLALGYLAYERLKSGAPAPGAPVAYTPANAAEPAPMRKLGSLAFVPCTLAPKGSPYTVEAQCARLSVPEDWDHAGGRKIELAIAWVPAKNDDAADPVFMLAGGPGQSALETYPSIGPAFADTLKKRSVILVDQRGTGGSNRLACKDDTGETLDTGATPSEGIERIRAFTQRCMESLSAKADLRLYTTTDAIRDLDAVRKTIGASMIDLVGVSYGTRVAQQYARRYPEHTRAVVLDSVAPNELIFGNDFARNLDDSLAMQFKLCQQLPRCAERMGDPRANLKTLLAQLKEHPVPVSYRDPTTGEQREEKLTRAHLALIARMSAYAPILAAALPLTLSEASKGHYEPMMAQARLIGGSLEDSLSAGMQLSVTCSEDADAMKADPAYADSVLGNELIDYLQAQCAIWPKGARPADFHQPLVSDRPFLVLEGEFDPVTPPRYGEQVVKHLRHGRLLVLRGQGHNVIPVGCMPKLMARFLDTADAASLDAKCLENLPYAPPFTSYAGWEP
jgi:pimeloyl-ACP methyl ester carboxylesterase